MKKRMLAFVILMAALLTVLVVAHYAPLFAPNVPSNAYVKPTIQPAFDLMKLAEVSDILVPGMDPPLIDRQAATLAEVNVNKKITPTPTPVPTDLPRFTPMPPMKPMDPWEPMPAMAPMLP